MINPFCKEQRSPAFYLYFYFHAFKGLLRRQDLVLPDDHFQIAYDLRVRRSDVQDWYRLFGAPLEGVPIPFGYYSRLYELFYLRYMDAMKFNYKNIRHLYHQRELLDEQGMVADRDYRVTFSISDMAVLPRNRAAIATAVEVKDKAGATISRQKDYIFLKNVSDANIALIRGAKQFSQRIPVDEFVNLSKQESVLTGRVGVQQVPVPIPAGLGLRYGHLSGDLNPLHTGRLLSRLFGIKRPFIQGGCTIHLLLKIFYADLKAKLSNYQVTFCRPVYEGQTLQLLYDQSRFELLDAQDKLLVRGSKR